MDHWDGVTVHHVQALGAIHSTKISENLGPKLNGSVRCNRKSFEKTGPPFEVVLFSRLDQSEFWLNGSRLLCITNSDKISDWDHQRLQFSRVKERQSRHKIAPRANKQPDRSFWSQQLYENYDFTE